MAANQYANFQQPVQAPVSQPQQPVGQVNGVNPQMPVQAPVSQPAFEQMDLYEPKPFLFPSGGDLGTTTPNQLATQPVQQPMPQQPMLQQPLPGMPQPQYANPVQPMAPQQPQWNPQQNPALAQLMQMQQPTTGLPTGLPQADPNAELLRQIAEQNKQMQAVVAKLAEAQTKTGDQPDYLSMDSSQLMALVNGDPETGEPGKLKDILNAVKQSASAEFEQKIQRQEELLNAVVRQHTETQAKIAVSQLKQKYADRDPMFHQNMLEVAAFVERPEGKAYFQQFPENAFETAYLMVQANKFNSPEYQQALALQAQAMQQNQNLQKLQGGMPGSAGMTPQNVVPFPMMQQNAQPQRGVSDMDVVAQILNADGGGYGIPNVRMA